MQKILEFLRQIPLVAVLAVTGLLLTGVALVCKDTAYADYETESFSRPFLSIVMEGIHDGVYPWSGGGNGDPAAEAGSTAATAEAVAAAEESPESAKENGGQEAPEETEEKENTEEKESADQEKKDYRQLCKDVLFLHPERYTIASDTLKHIQLWKGLFLKTYGIAAPKHYKAMYEGLLYGDPKSRVLRILWTSIYQDYDNSTE